MMDTIKKYHWILPYIACVVFTFLFVHSCEQSKVDALKSASDRVAYDSEKKLLKDHITLQDGIIVGHRFKEQHLAIENQALRAKSDKLPTARSFKRSQPELDSTPKKALKGEYVALQAVDSAREAITKKALDNNDSLIAEVEKEHVVTDSKDSTENKLVTFCDSTVAAERKRADKAEKKAERGWLAAKIEAGVIALLILLDLAK